MPNMVVRAFKHNNDFRKGTTTQTCLCIKKQQIVLTYSSIVYCICFHFVANKLDMNNLISIADYEKTAYLLL